MLTGGRATALPPITELTAAVTSLARGFREKVLLSVGEEPTEFALVRRGDQVLASCYDTGSAPEVLLLDRPIALAPLLRACARETLEEAQLLSDPTTRQVAVKLAERALAIEIEDDPAVNVAPTIRRGGARRPNGEPLTFGYEARVFPSAHPTSARSSQSDVHAMLFAGQLWAFVHGKRVPLARGPIMLPVQRMVVAARALIDAWDEAKPCHVRLCVSGFQVSARYDGRETAALSFEDDSQRISVPGLSVDQAALPILSVASDILRSLVAADRAQNRNLRVSDLREEVRELRRRVRGRQKMSGFVNRDADRLRALNRSVRKEVRPEPAPRSLRFGERWRIALDGLDATSTFFCGDRLVMSTPRITLAVSRETGDALWVRDGGGSTALMASSILLRAFPEGDVELCDVEDGEARATTRIAPRVGGAMTSVLVGGGNIPQMAVLSEGARRLVAVDVRTGIPRWRFLTEGSGNHFVCRAGRILLVASSTGSLHALDVANGEELWRYNSRRRVAFAPQVSGDTAILAAGEPGGRLGAIIGVDLYTGEERFCSELPTGPSCRPIVAGELVAVTSGEHLVFCEADSGAVRFLTEDPGLSSGAALMVDDLLIVNAPGGRLTAIDVKKQGVAWSRVLGEPAIDEVPRSLEPVLRGGALFVPGGAVSVIRPIDGTVIGALPCDLVPDLIRVDERGWVYIAEESGHMAAFAPIPHLRLISGGR